MPTLAVGMLVTRENYDMPTASVGMAPFPSTFRYRNLLGTRSTRGQRTLSLLEQQRREVYYSGRVQGVGFRFTVRALAGRFAVAGFVRNLPDGGVHLAVEGSAGEIDRFLEAIQAEMRHYIAATQQTVSPATGRFNAFEIRH